METAEAIKLWNELGLKSATMEFSCGGDSMSDWSFTFYDEKGEVSCEKLRLFFDDEVFNKVEFYVNSDGHYQGEAGQVEITLEDGDFSYLKDAEAEYEEQHSEETLVPMSAKMIKFIEENVFNINGGDGDAIINFKKDLILNDEQEILMNEIEELLKDTSDTFEPKEINEELNDWRSFTTGENELTVTDNSLKINMTVSYTKFEPSE